jgi:dTDP-4-amino-4,6-dideoxygalactose transaminase
MAECAGPATLPRAQSAERPRDAQPFIPVLRPQLPDAHAILPYLQKIDGSRIYSNWGPLLTELTDRLGRLFDIESPGVVCANSGTSALVGAILATAGRATRDRPLAVVPDFTFTATALAAQECGYELALADCNRDTWSFRPEDLLERPELLERVGLVVPVAPFGRVLAQQPWLDFRQATGIPVVIDGAACFEALSVPPRMGAGAIPIALSFHATKSFGMGEGGCVATTDLPLAVRTLQCLNFGFINGRNSEVSGVNGKMSEYAAAVGLAELDGWARKHQTIRTVIGHYRRESEACGLGSRLITFPRISSSYVLLDCSDAARAERVMLAMADSGVDTRLWYGAGLHAHDVFRQCTRLALFGDAALDPATLVGLPMAVDLTEGQIARICQVAAPHF